MKINSGEHVSTLRMTDAEAEEVVLALQAVLLRRKKLIAHAAELAAWNDAAVTMADDRHKVVISICSV